MKTLVGEMRMECFLQLLWVSGCPRAKSFQREGQYELQTLYASRDVARHANLEPAEFPVADEVHTLHVVLILRKRKPRPKSGLSGKPSSATGSSLRAEEPH